MTGFWTYWGTEETNNGYKETFGIFTRKEQMWDMLGEFMRENGDTTLEFRDWLDKNFTGAELFMEVGNYDTAYGATKGILLQYIDEVYTMKEDSPEPIKGEDYVINGHIFKWIDTGEFTVHENSDSW